MELTPLNINNFNNFTNYNYHITPHNFDKQHDNHINQTTQEDWGFVSLNKLIKDENIWVNNPNISVIKDENIWVINPNISVINQKDPIGNEYDSSVGVYLQQSVNNPEIPTEVATKGTVYWNGNSCLYSSGEATSNLISTIEKSYFKKFFEENKNSYTNIRSIDPNSDKLYTFFSSICNKQTCTTSNLNGTTVNKNYFICPNSQPTELAYNEKNTLWKNAGCFHKPVNFTSSSPFNCRYPYWIGSKLVELNSVLDKKSNNDNIDDNFFCYPFFSSNIRLEDCVKEKLDLLNINSNDFKFFFPKPFSKTTFIWDEDHNRCFYYDGVEINYNKVFYYGNFPYIYSYHSINSSCNINSCKNNKIVPTSNGFSCSLTSSLSNLHSNKIMVKQSVNPSIPTEVAIQGTAYWNGNSCLYSSGDPSSSLISTIEKSYSKTFLIENKNTYNNIIDPNSDKIYTFYSQYCDKKTCTTINLNGESIGYNNFSCNNNQYTKLSSNEKNTLWKNGKCFHKPISFTPASSFGCFYPSFLLSYSPVISHYAVTLNTVSESKLTNNNINDDLFCYPFFSSSPLPEDCVKEKLDLLNINSNNFNVFFPKQFSKTTFIWDEYHNRCFYYDGIEVNSNKFFYYGNLPYMYSYHSNDLSCDINNCKDGMTISSNQNQFQCIKKTSTPPTTPIPNYGIREYYSVDFSMIEKFFNFIGSLFKIPSMDTLHWAIFFPLMVILYPLSPWITVFVEPWINLSNSIQLFMAIKN
jgi:hypothetical protein